MEGILALRALAESDPPNVDAVVWLGIFGIQSGQLDKARERFSEALTLEPGHLEATWQLAMLDMEEGAYDRALSVLKPSWAKIRPMRTVCSSQPAAMKQWAKQKRRSSATTNTYLTPRTP